MNLSRRAFARVCALTATGRALAGALPGLAQVQGEHFNTTARASGACHPGHRNTRTEKRAHGVVPRGALRHVHPLGPVFDPAGRWDGKEVPGIGEWIMNQRLHPGGAVQGTGLAIQSDAVQRGSELSAWQNPPA